MRRKIEWDKFLVFEIVAILLLFAMFFLWPVR